MDEYASADKTYFVQPGDSTATVKRKQRARAKILDSLQHQGSNSGGNGGRGTGAGNRGGELRPMPSHGSSTRRIGRFEGIE